MKFWSYKVIITSPSLDKLDHEGCRSFQVKFKEWFLTPFICINFNSYYRRDHKVNRFIWNIVCFNKMISFQCKLQLGEQVDIGLTVYEATN